jgi:hypothetical protein
VVNDQAADTRVTSTGWARADTARECDRYARSFTRPTDGRLVHTR